MSCTRLCWSNSNICANDPSCPPRRQVSVFYFVTTVVGMVVLALFTLLFLFCLFLKRRRIQLRHNPRLRSDVRAFETTVTFYGPGVSSSTLPVATIPGTRSAGADPHPVKSVGDGTGAPFTCVIMAGEDQPTFIAHPIPNSSVTSSSTPPESTNSAGLINHTDTQSSSASKS